MNFIVTQGLLSSLLVVQGYIGESPSSSNANVFDSPDFKSSVFGVFSPVR
jgi:hypothetical protein